MRRELLTACCTLALLGSVALADPADTCTITWTAPTTNKDGSPLTDLASYRLYRDGTKQGSDIAAPVTSVVTTTACLPGTYTVTAVNAVGVESAPSSPFVVFTPGAPTSLGVHK